jgi:hypothetical protein
MSSELPLDGLATMEHSIACNTLEAEADAATGWLHAIDEHAPQGMTWHAHRFAP